MAESRTRVFVFAAVSLGLAAGIFVLDLLTPLRIPIWLFYLAPIVVVLWALTPSRSGPFALACLCPVLTLPGLYLFLFPAGTSATFVLINRSFGLLLFCITESYVAVPQAQGQMPKEGRGAPSRRFVESIAGAGILLVLLIVTLYQATKLYRPSTQVIAHAHDVLATLAGVETGPQDFLLTGHDPYWEPYNQALIRLEEHIQYPKALAQSIPVQKNGFPDLKAKIADKSEDFRETVMARWNEEPGAVFRIVMGDQGTTTMGEICSALAGMEGIEHGFLVEWRQLSGNMFPAMLLYLGLGGLLQIGLLIADGLFMPLAQIAGQVRIKSDPAMHKALAMLRGVRAIAPNLVTMGDAT